jgi:hypothetical protein
MIQTVRRRRFDTRSIQWLGTNAIEVRAFCPGFRTVDVEDRGDDPEATAELYEAPHGRWRPICDGDHIVAVPGGFKRYTDEAYVAEFEPVRP